MSKRPHDGDAMSSAGECYARLYIGYSNLSPNFTWLVTSRLDTFDVSNQCILFASSLSNSATARHVRIDALNTSNVSSRIETWRDEPSGIWALPLELSQCYSYLTLHRGALRGVRDFGWPDVA